MKKLRRIAEGEAMAAGHVGDARQVVRAEETPRHLLEDDGLSRTFHDAAHGADHHADDGAGDDDDHFGWKARARELDYGKGRRRNRGYRRDDGPDVPDAPDPGDGGDP